MEIKEDPIVMKRIKEILHQKCTAELFTLLKETQNEIPIHMDDSEPHEVYSDVSFSLALISELQRRVEKIFTSEV